MLSFGFAYVHEAAHLAVCKLLRIPHTFAGYNSTKEQFEVDYESGLWQASLVNVAPVVLVVPAFFSFKLFFAMDSVLQWFFFLVGLGLGTAFLPSLPDSSVVLDVSPFYPLSSLLALIHLPFFLFQLPSFYSSEYPHFLKILASFGLFAIVSPSVSICSLTHGVPW